jgi:hypothetical protein
MIRLLCLISIFCSLYAKAQIDPIRDFNKHVIENWTGEAIRISQYMVKGSPYFLGEAFTGSIRYKGGRVVNDKLLYDLYLQKAGPEMNGGIFESTDPVEQFTLKLPLSMGGNSLLFKNSLLYKGASAGFFNVLAEGAGLSLIKHFKTKLSPDPKNTLAKEQKIFEQYYEYYLYDFRDSSLHKAKLREKDLLKLMQNDPRVIEYIKVQDLDLYNNEVDVVNCINFYNGLIQKEQEKK